MKKRIANIIMVVIILIIAAGGVVYAGMVRGWFDKEENCVMLTEIRGIVNIARDGVSFPVNEETTLRKGDRISCTPGATAKIKLDDLSYLVMGEKADVVIIEPDTGTFNAEVSQGEVFTVSKSEDTAITLSFDGKQEEFTDTIASLSVRPGAQSINVYQGKAEDSEAGHMLSWIGGELSVKALPIESLNSFNISRLRTVNKLYETCFTDEMLDKLEQDRLAEKLAQQETQNKENKPENKPAEAETPEENSGKSDSEASDTKPDDNKQTEKDPVKPEENKPSNDSPTGNEQTPPAQEPSSENKPELPEPPDPETDVPPPPTEPEQPEETPQPSCTISIVCDTILNNWDDLDPAKGSYVPSNGVILSTVSVSFTQGETVFDVLKRACSDYGIQLEYSWTPLYGSYYVEGINYLYEFDCGFESGWMYKVNGWFPNYGCSSYTLNDGDSIVWCYTCKGLGADVGGGL